MDLSLIETNYNLKLSSCKLIDSHFGTEIYLIDTDMGKFIVKSVPYSDVITEEEGRITEYLRERGLNVPVFQKTVKGFFSVNTSACCFTVQEYIKGEVYAVNNAPEYIVEGLAEYLGRTAWLLKGYKPLPMRFGKEFFSNNAVERKLQHYMEEFEKAEHRGNRALALLWKEQIRHLEKISSFEIDTDRLTYTNSHGDYHIGQVIARGNDITVVDWSSACCLPVCLDVVTSYVFASKSCAFGEIDANGLRRYIERFTAEFPLCEYDVKMMPYVLYFWHTMCNYRPDEMDGLDGSYRQISKLINAFQNWLYDNVEVLSEELATR